MIEDDAGTCKVVIDPQVPGFHYYSQLIALVSVAQPVSASFYCSGKMLSGIEIPEAGFVFLLLRTYHMAKSDGSGIFPRKQVPD